MYFDVQPCFPGDAPGLAATMMSARLTDPHWAILWEDPSAESIISRAIDRVPLNLVTGRDTKRHQKVVIRGTNQVVGYARWVLPPSLAEKHDVWLEAQTPEASPTELATYQAQHRASTKNGQPIGMKGGTLMADRSAPLEAVDARIMQDGPYLVLDYLTTHPDFWRRGIGSMLVQSGLQIADRYNIKTYVMSEPAALKLYLNHGFKLVETVSKDYSYYGGTEPAVHHFLIREPNVCTPA